MQGSFPLLSLFRRSSGAKRRQHDAHRRSPPEFMRQLRPRGGYRFNNLVYCWGKQEGLLKSGVKSACATFQADCAVIGKWVMYETLNVRSASPAKWRPNELDLD